MFWLSNDKFMRFIILNFLIFMILQLLESSDFSISEFLRNIIQVLQTCGLTDVVDAIKYSFRIDVD